MKIITTILALLVSTGLLAQPTLISSVSLGGTGTQGVGFGSGFEGAVDEMLVVPHFTLDGAYGYSTLKKLGARSGNTWGYSANAAYWPTKHLYLGAFYGGGGYVSRFTAPTEVWRTSGCCSFVYGAGAASDTWTFDLSYSPPSAHAHAKSAAVQWSTLILRDASDKRQNRRTQLWVYTYLASEQYQQPLIPHGLGYSAGAGLTVTFTNGRDWRRR